MKRRDSPSAPRFPGIPGGCGLRLVVCCAVGALFIAVPGTLGVYWDPEAGSLAIGKLVAALVAGCWWALAFCVLLALGRVFGGRPRGVVAPVPANPARLLRERGFRRRVLAGSALLALFWLPYLVIMFPGPMCWDTYFQAAQCFPERYPMVSVWGGGAGAVSLDARFIDHHPVLDSLLYGAFVVPSARLTGSWDAGVFAFGAVQVLALSFSVSFLVGYMGRLGAPMALQLISAAFYAAVPLFGMYSCMMLKDVTFSLLFIWWLVYFAEAARTRGEALSDRGALAALVALSAVAPLTKKVGLAVIAPSLLLLAIYVRGRWGRVGAALAGSMLVTLLAFPLLAYPLLGVAPGGKQEMLSVLFQQTARYAKHHPGDVAEGDREAIDRLIGYGTLAERYDPVNSNPVKGRYDYFASNGDILAYLAVWARQGMSDPVLYLKSTWSTCYGFYSPTAAFDQYMSPMPRADYVREGDVSNPPALAGYRSDLIKAYGALKSAKGIDALVSIVLYCWWIPVAGLCLRAAGRDRAGALCFAPLLLSAATCVLSFEPGIGRYVLHLAYVAPMAAFLGLYGLEAPPGEGAQDA